MITKFFSLWFKWKGWKIEGVPPAGLKKAVVIAAPHTSNWDFIYALAVFRILKLHVHYLIKKEVYRFPLSILIRNTGGIPVERSKKQNLIDQIVEKFNATDELLVTIAAEGTRKRVEKWKSGFYYTALKAGVPVLPGYLDYKNKKAGFGAPIHLTGNKEEDMAKFRAFFADKTGKHPELFNVEAIKID